jgi:hypothetical protein
VAPVRVEPVPGTPYGLAIFGPPATTSGPAIGALVAGVASIVVSFLVGCVGLDGWGILAAGAFAILAGCLGGAGIALGLVGARQTRRPSGSSRSTGRSLAIAGGVCGAVGLGITGCVLGAVALIEFV